MKSLKISPTFSLPFDSVNDVIAIVGRRGRGKTTTAVVLVEEIDEFGGRFVIADPVGVWWGLKSSKNGQKKGIAIVVMGGEHADVPLEETSGKVIADFVIDPTSPNVVLDFRGFRKAQMTRFMVDFLEQLYHKNRAPLHVVLDEADQFAPQRVMGETARLVGATEDVCKMGRARGLHPILITQRPAALNKNVLTQAGVLISHQLTGPQDRKALDEWIRANAEESERDKFLETIPTLERGVAWFWQPENGTFELVNVRDRHTYDSSSTPKTGIVHAPKVLAEVDLEALKIKIAATIEKAKLTDPKELQRTIVNLKKQLSEKQSVLITGSIKEKRIEIPILKDAQIKRLETLFNKMTIEAKRHGNAMNIFWGNQNELAESFLKTISIIKQPAKITPLKTLRQEVSIHQNVQSIILDESKKFPHGEHKVLVAIAQHPSGITREQTTILTAYKTSTRNAYILRLMQRGYITESGDNLIVTDKGQQQLGADFEQLPTGDALRDYWLTHLPKGEREVFSAACDVYPKEVSREQIGEITGYKTSTRNAYILRLKTRKIINVNSTGIQASEMVFN